MKAAQVILILIGIFANVFRTDSCKFGENCDYPCHCQNNEVCNPTDGSCPTGCGDGDLREQGDHWYTGAWSGYGCQIGNVAYNKFATQAKNVSNNHAGLAVDGNQNAYFSNCAHTNRVPGHSNWWQVDLGATYVVQSINITNVRSNNCCQNRMQYIDIYVTEGQDEEIPNGICYTIYEEGAVDFLHINCTRPIIGRYVKLRQHANYSDISITMNICEVQVYGYPYRDCPDDYFGVACGIPCNCQVPCDDITGECPGQKCVEGWGSKDCQTESCKFGENCDYPCHCQNNEVCNPTNGSCPSGCDDGDLREPGDYWYTGAWGGYGCQIGNVAYNKTATQTRSDSLFRADLAVDGNHNTYFRDCAHPHQVPGYGNWWQVDLGETYVVQSVNITNVRSNNCCQDRMRYIDIYVTEGLDEEMPDRICYTIQEEGAVDVLYINCTQPMIGKYVKFQQHANPSDLSINLNICEVQVYGYPYHDCPDDYFGVACGTTCNCHAPCDDITGECPGQNCLDGWMANDCQTPCTPGAWGPSCLQQCNCQDEQEICDRFNGSCTTGCNIGYRGVGCNLACPPGAWGQSCLQQCNCQDEQEICDHSNGSCTTGCPMGYGGIGCNLVLPSLLSEVQLSSASRNALQIHFDNWTPTTSNDTIPTAYHIQWKSIDSLEWLHYLEIGHSAIVHNYTISIENLEPDSLYLVRIVPLVEDGNVIYYGIPTPVYGPFSTRSYVADNADTRSDLPVIIGVVVAVILLIVLAIMFACLFRRSHKRNEHDSMDPVYQNDLDHGSQEAMDSAGYANTEANGHHHDNYEEIVDVAGQTTSDTYDKIVDVAKQTKSDTYEEISDVTEKIKTDSEYEYPDLKTVVHNQPPYVDIVDSKAQNTFVTGYEDM